MKSQNKVTKFLLSTMFVLLTIVALVPSAKAAPPARLFTATIDPTAAYVGETKTYTITITNIGSGSGNSYDLGSAKVTVPTSGFTVDGSTLSVTRVPSGTAWTAVLVAGEIQLSTTGTGKLGYEESLLISFDATAVAAGIWEWTTSAYVGTDWTTAATISGPQPTVTVTQPEEGDWIRETAWADGDPYNTDGGNWATYTPYSGAELDDVILYAGQTMEAGTVDFSAPAGGLVTITITLNAGWRFYDNTENVKIQDYAEAPSGNPKPGQFDSKGYATGSPFSINVPENNFYGVHVDVEREL
jgi:hypothetical protein